MHVNRDRDRPGAAGLPMDRHSHEEAHRDLAEGLADVRRRLEALEAHHATPASAPVAPNTWDISRWDEADRKFFMALQEERFNAKTREERGSLTAQMIRLADKYKLAEKPDRQAVGTEPGDLISYATHPMEGHAAAAEVASWDVVQKAVNSLRLLEQESFSHGILRWCLDGGPGELADRLEAAIREATAIRAARGEG